MISTFCTIQNLTTDTGARNNARDLPKKISRSHSQPSSLRDKLKQPSGQSQQDRLKQMPQELLKQTQPEKHKQSPEGSQQEKLKQPQRSGHNRTVQIRLQSCPRIRDQEPSTSGHKDVSREVSNSSNYSEMTSVDGMISPNPRAKRNPPLEEGRPSASPISKDQTISNKLAATLSPMIKRKVISAMQSVQANQNTLPPPKSNMYLAFITLFICPPLGCLAWHHARKVNKLMADDMTRARLASKMAATYSYIGFLIGGLILTAIFVAYVLVDAL